MRTDTMMQTILIIDDEVTNIAALNELLQSGYNILFAKDGPTGIKLATSTLRPDLILLDILMPEMDGYQVMHLLQCDEYTKNIPVIFITAKGDEEDEVRGFALGAVDYISKPFRPIVVKARIKSAMELKRHRDFLEWMLKERTKELQQMEKEYFNMFYRKA
ncbi:MAG: response regulator [Smithellaceae bacterium]|nr:response regulator [Syntrophaceae bacterium]MDD4240652.1 response regulator [Smithellaceae bacterium]NLX52015.1 response regulator [Deltaproteobacteria bacterium]